MKTKHEASCLECDSRKHALKTSSNQNKALNNALATERNKNLNIVKSNEGLKERHETRVDEKDFLSKEVTGLCKNKLGENAMQVELDFAKRELDSASLRCNAADPKAKIACDAHLRNDSDTCKQNIQSTNKTGYFTVLRGQFFESGVNEK